LFYSIYLLRNVDYSQLAELIPPKFVSLECNTYKKTTMPEKSRIVQVKNPKTGHYVKIDRQEGRILSNKKSQGPYKGVKVARKSSK
jgi:hypothetical protein